MERVKSCCFCVCLFFLTLLLIIVKKGSIDPTVEGYSACPISYLENDNYQGARWYDVPTVSSPTMVTTFTEEMPENKERHSHPEKYQPLNQLNESGSCDAIQTLSQPPMEQPIMVYLSCKGDGCKDYPEATTIQDSPVNINYYQQFDNLFQGIEQQEIIVNDINVDKLYSDPSVLEEEQEKKTKDLAEKYSSLSRSEISSAFDGLEKYIDNIEEEMFQYGDPDEEIVVFTIPYNDSEIEVSCWSSFTDLINANNIPTESGEQCHMIGEHIVKLPTTTEELPIEYFYEPNEEIWQSSDDISGTFDLVVTETQGPEFTITEEETTEDQYNSLVILCALNGDDTSCNGVPECSWNVDVVNTAPPNGQCQVNHIVFCPTVSEPSACDSSVIGGQGCLWEPEGGSDGSGVCIDNTG